MEILTWFGRVDTESCSFVPSKDEAEMAKSWQSPEAAQLEKQPDLRALAKACGYASDDQEYNARLREAAIRLVRGQLKAWATSEQDLLHAVEALDDMNQAVNLLDERLYEWSRLHRDEIVHGRDLADCLSQDKSMGELARAILSLRKSRQRMEEEVASATTSLAPNLSALAGPVLAARLISRAGSLKRLAEMPSSVIQVMGAEKSLFKHLHGKAPSPKHGIIYRHPAILGTPKTLRGRMARTLAAKLAIAARLDYNGSSLLPELKSALDRRIIEVRRSKKAPARR